VEERSPQEEKREVGRGRARKLKRKERPARTECQEFDLRPRSAFAKTGLRGIPPNKSRLRTWRYPGVSRPTGSKEENLLDSSIGGGRRKWSGKGRGGTLRLRRRGET